MVHYLWCAIFVKFYIRRNKEPIILLDCPRGTMPLWRESPRDEFLMPHFQVLHLETESQ